MREHQQRAAGLVSEQKPTSQNLVEPLLDAEAACAFREVGGTRPTAPQNFLKIVLAAPAVQFAKPIATLHTSVVKFYLNKIPLVVQIKACDVFWGAGQGGVAVIPIGVKADGQQLSCSSIVNYQGDKNAVLDRGSYVLAKSLPAH